MSAKTIVTTTNPTLAHYQCGVGCGTLTFSWDAKVYPNGGRTGRVTLGQFHDKPIQVYDPKPLYQVGTQCQIGINWGFQAQDGSFVGRILVSTYQTIVRFANFRPGDNWPQVTCLFSTLDARDSREAIEKAL